jgi:hypothetical protein
MLSRGTGTNVHRAYCAATNPNLDLSTEALKRGDWHHLASATDDVASATDDLRPRPNTGDPTPTGVLYHVVLLIASRYTLVIPRL